MKKIFILGLSLLMVVSMASCGKTEEPETTSEHNYAENDIVNKPTEETTTSNTEVEVIVIEEPEEKTKPTIEDPLDMYYNVTDDPNMNSVLDMNTVSIDGKMVAFPCDYEYLVEKFGSFYTESTGKYIIKTDIDETTRATSIDVKTEPTSGEGSIIFKFRSSDGTEKPITELTCIGFTLQAGSNYNEKLMTCALPNWISFGSSPDQIQEYFTEIPKNDSFVKSDSFMLFYEYDMYDIRFVGYDGGLYNIDVTYK